MNQKKITLKTNYNQKLGCPVFIHIDVAPVNGIPESKLENTVIEIHTADGSHEPVRYKLFDLARVKLKDLPGQYVELSHALPKDKYIHELLNNSKTITTETEMGLYFYKIFKE